MIFAYVVWGIDVDMTHIAETVNALISGLGLLAFVKNRRYFRRVNSSSFIQDAFELEPM